MPNLRRHAVELSCGRTVEVAFRRLAADAPVRPEREGELHCCCACPGDRVQLRAVGALRDGRADAERRCPDCGADDDGSWPAAAFTTYEDQLRHGLDRIARTVERLEQERMATFAEAFARALADERIDPGDSAA